MVGGGGGFVERKKEDKGGKGRRIEENAKTGKLRTSPLGDFLSTFVKHAEGVVVKEVCGRSSRWRGQWCWCCDNDGVAGW